MADFYQQQYEKGTKMISPTTGRMIITGGSAWKKLAREGKVNPTLKQKSPTQSQSQPIKVITTKQNAVKKTRPVRKKKKYVVRETPKPDPVTYTERYESDSEEIEIVKDESEDFSDDDSDW